MRFWKQVFGTWLIATELADLGATAEEAERIVEALGTSDRSRVSAVVAALTDHVYLHRTASTVQHAVAQIQRIVGALKTYSHLDQQATRTDADVHEGLETTLALLHHALRDIVVERRYGVLPRVPVFVDELNQVWTNLIRTPSRRSPVGEGAITIETSVDGDSISIRVIDDGPGVPAERRPRIFEPFFTTKPKGEGTGPRPRHRAPDRRQARRRAALRVRPRSHRASRSACRSSRGPAREPPRSDRLRRRRRGRAARAARPARRALRPRVPDRDGAHRATKPSRCSTSSRAKAKSIAVVIADQIMPGMKGVELLEIVDRRLPIDDQDPAHRPGRPRRRRRGDQPRAPEPVHRQAVGRDRAAARRREPAAPVPARRTRTSS